MTITEDMQAAILKVPAGSWPPAYDGDGQVREGAWVADALRNRIYRALHQGTEYQWAR